MLEKIQSNLCPKKVVSRGTAIILVLAMAVGFFFASDLTGTAFAATANLHYQLQPDLSILNPVSVGSADLNGDGYEDLVVANNGSFEPEGNLAELHIFWGSDEGLSTPAESYNLGGPYDAVRGLEIYDLNLDGHLDIAVAMRDTNCVKVYLGDDDGAFTYPGHYPTAYAPQDVVAGDFNGDGVIDLATSNYNREGTQATVSILLGTGGDFGFSAPTNYSFSCWSYSLVAADFDQDGDLDLAVTTYVDNLIYILNNDGNGNFGDTFDTYATGSAVQSIVCGDFNGDNYPDLAITTQNEVNVFLNIADGTFASRQQYGSFKGYQGLTVKDFNGDGKLDLISSNNKNGYLDGYDNDEIEALLGNGDGTFRQGGTWAITASDVSRQFGPWSLTAGDYNGDNLPDIASGCDYDGVVALLEAYIVPVTAISVNPSGLEMDDGETATLSITVSPVDASNPVVAWNSADETVVHVDENGVVTAMAPGSATVTAVSTENSEITDTCVITVVPVLVTGITLNPDALTLRAGNTRTLIADVDPSNATNSTVIWSSDDESVARVENGVVTAVAVGSATITATSQDNPDVYDTCEVTVARAWVPPPTPVPVFTEAISLYGDNRILTAIAISQSLYPQDGNGKAVVLARADNYPDALAGVPLAYALDAPLLLTYPDVLDTAVAQEIDRVLEGSGTIYILGGEAAISTSVTETLKDEYEVVRFNGNNRYQTAVNIAKTLTLTPVSVYLVTGQDFPDGVSISSIAARLGAPILLTEADNLPTATADYLKANNSTIENVYVVGGTGVISEDVYTQAGGTERIFGANRWATSAAVAQRFFPTPSVITLSTGRNFPDSLTGGVLAASHNAPILTTQPSLLPSEIEAYIEQKSTGIVDVYVFGGPAAVNPSVYNQLNDLLK